jgi:hypothetical protein
MATLLASVTGETGNHSMNSVLSGRVVGFIHAKASHTTADKQPTTPTRINP